MERENRITSVEMQRNIQLLKHDCMLAGSCLSPNCPNSTPAPTPLSLDEYLLECLPLYANKNLFDDERDQSKHKSSAGQASVSSNAKKPASGPTNVEGSNENKLPCKYFFVFNFC